MTRDLLGRGLLICSLCLLGVTPVYGEKQGAARSDEESKDQVTVHTGTPPAESEKDAAVDAAGRALAQEGDVTTKLTVNCGVVTCSYYLSRGETRAVANKGVLAADAAGLIPTVGPLLSKVVKIANDTAKAAAKRNQCLRVRVIALSGLPVGIYQDGGRFCRN
jgi:hypothetical protein